MPTVNSMPNFSKSPKLHTIYDRNIMPDELRITTWLNPRGFALTAEDVPQ